LDVVMSGFGCLNPAIDLRLYVKLALATGVPFGVIIGVTHAIRPASGAVISGVVFGTLMSAILGTFQLRADRAAERRAAASRRIRMEKDRKESNGD
jgi:hypothetical protein